MKILFAASEGVPFCKTGGLADVVGALPEALASQRHSIRVVLPLYQQIREQFPKVEFMGRTVHVPFEGKMEPVQIWRTSVRPSLVFIFADAPKFFARPGIYGARPGTPYPDNDRRYAFFSRSVLEIAKGVSFRPEIIHGHDWQTGLVMAYLKLLYARDSFFSKTAGVFTIHNIAYQGNFPASSFAVTGLPTHAYHPKAVEFYGQVNFLKAGLVYADALNTVSPTYAKEIRSDPHFGFGLEGVLQERSADFKGILNGLDVDFWNPKADPYLATRYDLPRVSKRALCKADLQKAAGFTVDDSIPLLAFIGRLDYQKGVDLLIDTAPSLLKEGVQFVTLGQGNPFYVLGLKKLQGNFPAQVHITTEFAESFAHKIYAGADLFLMPSRFEPCGLSQLIAMRYGSVPVVTPTGGLLDTVRDSTNVRGGTGFVAASISSGAFLDTLFRALRLFDDKKTWRKLQERAMRQDFSWKKSVAHYLSMYENVVRS